ncbi:MAG: RagB/SusD family nutrient uptake outer membrane protein [Gemmatimonadota bacterium]|nr:RagB/SusD family nutrient uptake outer membrane protein [Gemmatimonadota bacterium]
MNWTKKARALAVLPVAMAFGACDILTIRDPGRYDDEDLDEALEAVANSAEGAVQEWIDWYVIWQSLLSDVYMFTGPHVAYYDTWGLIDEGWIDYGTFPTNGTNGDMYWTYAYTGNFPDAMAQHKWFAVESWERLVRVKNEEFANSDLMGVQILLGKALYDMYTALFSCEAVLDEAPSQMYADEQIYPQVADTFARVIEVALNVDPEVLERSKTEYVNVARTGRALMLMLSGEYDEAAAEASAVPDGFTYDAVKTNVFRDWNKLAYLNGRFNRYAGLMSWLWDRIDIGLNGFIKDERTGVPDTRMPVSFLNQRGSDSETPYYGQRKYPDFGSPIPMLHSGHARLIEAEAKVMQGDYAGATGLLNSLRAGVGLPSVAVPATEDDMIDFLLDERFAELFLEGHRAVDLHRFRLTRRVFDDMNDVIRPGTGRPSKFPGSSREGQLNKDVENVKNVRCSPVGV